MPIFEAARAAALVESIHQPKRSTVGACLDRWSALDRDARAHCYLIVEGDEPGARVTLNGREIEQLAHTSSSRGLARASA